MQVDSANCFSKTFRRVEERLGDCPRVSRISRKISEAIDGDEIPPSIFRKKISSFAG